ncbi:MAG: hypothetical protein EYC71_05550 [Gammaproteobacteria bacterium]|nr:MAG: hypothetical protein EYC71_05550 [Gammaproteobacteria bacterium]
MGSLRRAVTLDRRASGLIRVKIGRGFSPTMPGMRQIFAIVAVFCLLFQQVAVAMAPCMPDDMQAQAQAPGHDCAGMPLAKASPTLCKAHCTPEPLVTPENKWPPILAMLAPIHSPDFKRVPEPLLPASLPAVQRSDPPLRLRYCSLQI